ncbi:MAG: hypothetical protein HY064_12480 [Bacteroidetes bacterium]|nr:hypothetical protein [Bacteroidota bacterium]
MRSSTDLFDLVRALRKSEKRYFKLNARFHSGEKSYLKLFDAIEKQRQYDEPALLRKFSGERFTANFSVAKKYLFDQLIKSLLSYGSYKDTDSDHSELIEIYKILEYKGLSTLALRYLDKAKIAASADEGFLKLYYVLTKEYIALAYSSSDASMGRIDELIGKRKKVLMQIENYSSVADILYRQRNFLRKRRYCRTKKEKDELRKIVSPLFKKKEKLMLSVTARGLFNTAICEYYNATGSPLKAIRHSGNYLQLNKKYSPDRIEIQTINELSTHLLLCLRNRFFRNYKEHLEDFYHKMVNLKNTNRFVLMYEKWLLFEIGYHNSTGDFEKGKQLLLREKNNFNHFERWMTKQGKMSLYYALAYNSFGMGEYKSALKWLNGILNDNSTMIEEFGFARILSILIYYDLGNTGLLESSVRSTYRFLLSRERLYKSEKLILDFIRRYKTIHNRKILRIKFSELKMNLEKNFRNPAERSILYYCDFPAWLQSKIEAKPFIDFAARYSPDKK